MKEIRIFRLPNGRSPYADWLEGLSEGLQFRIDSFVERVAMGGAKKNVRSLGDQIFEIKINTGPGYRVYFGQDGECLILLLLGGDKGSQRRDIAKAKEFWRLYYESK